MERIPIENPGLSQKHSLRKPFILFCDQRYNLLPRATALYNVELPLFYAGITGAAAEEKARTALEQVGILHLAGHWPNQMSGVSNSGWPLPGLWSTFLC